MACSQLDACGFFNQACNETSTIRYLMRLESGKSEPDVMAFSFIIDKGLPPLADGDEKMKISIPNMATT